MHLKYLFLWNKWKWALHSIVVSKPCFTNEHSYVRRSHDPIEHISFYFVD